MFRNVGPLILISGGCSVSPQTQPPAHKDYAAMGCAELVEESKRLLRAQADRSEYLIEDREQKHTAPRISAVRKAIKDKGCSV